MKRNIQTDKSFIQYVETPLIAGDLNAYKIVWNLGADAVGSSIKITVKRSDGVIITDVGEIDSNGVASYTMANNMYAVEGSLEARLSVLSVSGEVTEKIMMFEVLSELEGEEITSDDRTPALTTLIFQVNNTLNGVNSHLADNSNPHNVNAEQIGVQQIVENNLNGFVINTKTGENAVTITDSNPLLPLSQISVLGNSTHTENYINITSATGASGVTTTVTDNTVVINGTTDTSTQFTLNFDSVTLKKDITYIITASGYTFWNTDNGISATTQATVTPEADTTLSKLYVNISAGTYANAVVSPVICNSSAVPSPTNPIPIVSVENPTITIGDKTVTFTGVTLRGCKNESGNFVNRDKIVTENGKVYLYRYVFKKVFTGYVTISNNYPASNPKAILVAYSIVAMGDYNSKTDSVICNMLPIITQAQMTSGMSGIYVYKMGGINTPKQCRINMLFPLGTFTANYTAFNAWANANGLEMWYTVKEPTKTEITGETADALLSIINEKNAEFTANSNGGIELTYNQNLNSAIAELKSAIISLGGTN